MVEIHLNNETNTLFKNKLTAFIMTLAMTLLFLKIKKIEIKQNKQKVKLIIFSFINNLLRDII